MPDRPETPIDQESQPSGHPASDDANSAEPGQGDFRGAYGYGRRAHKAGPNATYVFDLDPPHTLPLKGTTY